MPTGDNSQNALVLSAYNDSTTMAGGSSWTQPTYTNQQYQQQLGCIHYWPNYDPWIPVHPTVVYTGTPSWCAGNVHVFACEHAEVCRCGKAKRDKPVCSHCGK